MKIGILGGSFNPPHNGHIGAAIAAAKALCLERVILIPANLPPHKSLPPGSPTGAQRLEMTRLAAEGHEILSVSDMELLRGGPSYTSLTLKELHAGQKDLEIWVITGTDMFLTLEEWHEPETLFALAAFAAVPRRAEDVPALLLQKKQLYEKYGVRSEVIDCVPVDISSTQIRGGGPERMADLPDGVSEYILENGLYGLRPGFLNGFAQKMS